MRNTGNLRGMSLELFTVTACQAALLLIILVFPASVQTQQKPTPQRPTAARPPRQVAATPAPKIPGCLVRPADAVMTVKRKADGSYDGQVFSNETGYTVGANDCEYFVVDVILPQGFKYTYYAPLTPVTISGGFAMQAFHENNCHLASFHTIIYRKPNTPGGANFTKVHEIKPQGVWLDGGAGGFSQCDFYRGGLNPCGLRYRQEASSLQRPIGY